MNITNKNEKCYAELLDKSKTEYIYQPRFSKLFMLGYMPDFYLPNKNVFIEIVGTRQAFNQNRPKIIEAQKLVNLEIIKPNGERYNGRGINKKYSSTRIKISKLNFDLARIVEDHKLDAKELSMILGISLPTVYSYIRTNRIKKNLLKKLKAVGYNVEDYIIHPETNQDAD